MMRKDCMVLPRHGFVFAFALIVLFLFTCGLLSGCSGSEKKEPLLGERIPLLTNVSDPAVSNLSDSSQADTNTKTSVILPDPWRNESWPQRGGYASHVMGHLALNRTVSQSPLRRMWQSSIGRGSTPALPLTASPVSAHGLIFTLDTQGQVSAFDLETGRVRWRMTSIRPEGERGAVLGGGLAYGEGRLYVAGGYNEIIALNWETGAVLWRASLPSAVRAAPTIDKGQVYVMTLDNRVMALSAERGAILWEQSALQESTGLIGAASPAVMGSMVFAAFSSGEIYALRAENGSVLWSDSLSSLRRGGALASLSDITAFPVVDEQAVYVLSYGDRMVALDLRSGERLWMRDMGGTQTPWLVGNTLFVLNNTQDLHAIDRQNGGVIWTTRLSTDTTQRARSPATFRITRPVLAGGVLWVGTTQSTLLGIDPKTGEILHTLSTGNSISLPPLVVRGALVLLTDQGALQVWE